MAEGNRLKRWQGNLLLSVTNASTIHSAEVRGVLEIITLYVRLPPIAASSIIN
jgi:hypothetical protein